MKINFVTPKMMEKLDKFLDSKPLNRMYKSASENPAKFATEMALVSALTKDAVGCYYYVTQSLHNERIPEDKRNFVASLDLMNGILNIALQLSIGLWIDRNASKWFDKTVGKKLDSVNTRKVASNIKEIIKNNPTAKNLSLEQIEEFLRTKIMGSKGKAATWLRVGFGAAVMLTATQVITKRVFVPFLSTPLATWFKDNYLGKKKKSSTQTPGVPTEPLVNRLPYNWAQNNTGKKDVFSSFTK